MKTAAPVLIAMLGVYWGGCSSYRFQGDATGAACVSASSANKYRIDSVTLKTEKRQLPNGQSASDPWDVATAAEMLGEEAIGSYVMRRKPNMFSSTGESIPVAVSVRVYNGSKDGVWSFVLPIVTLGVGPVWMGTPSHCDVTVVILNDQTLRRSCPLKYRSDMLFSVFSPIGMMSYDEVQGVASCHKGSGVMKAPHLDATCRTDRDTVFIETLAEGIESCIREVEKRTPPSVLAQFASDAQESLDTPANTERSMIRRLGDLKKAGVLTAEECEAKRKIWTKHL